MKSLKALPAVNLIRKPVRTTALVILCVLLAISAFGGSLIVRSLRNGIDSLENRLGADIIVVPYEAATKGSYESVILQGNPGAFYMDKSVMNEIDEEIDGIKQMTPQYFLVSAKAGCCSIKVQIIGFDPETDFSVKPWLERSYSDTLGDGDVIIGASVEVSTGGDIKLFDKTCRVVGQLERTGTELDSAIYCNENTIKTLMQAAKVKQLVEYYDSDPENAISSVLIKVDEGVDIDSVVGDINLHVRGVKAIRTKNMISSVSDSLAGVSSVIGILMAAVWILVLIILVIAFFMMNNERKKEFAILRVIGASRGKLAGIIFCESLILSAVGSVIGVGLTALVGVLFGKSVTAAIGIPFLLPSADMILLTGLVTVAATMLAGAVTAALSALKTAKMDTGLILRGDNG